MVVGWGGRSLSLCWVGCHACLVVGSLPFSCSGGGGCSLLLLSSSGGRWSFGMVAGCHGSLFLSHSGGGGCCWVGWLLVVVVLGGLPCVPGCGLIAVFAQ